MQAMRGEILDSRGHRLAMSVQLDSIAVNPRALADPAESARVLARALHLDEQSLLARIERFRAKRKAFMWVKRAIPLEEGEALRSLDVNWIDWRREGKRVYPNGTLAANLLGGVDKDQTGIAGIEAGRKLELRFKGPGMRGSLTYMIEEPDQDECTLRQIESIRLVGVLRLLSPLYERLLRPRLKSRMEDIRDDLERGPEEQGSSAST
ncbi:MAG: hypothetical protein DYH06_08905 [Acidobacteria bacterium ACB2]|nr:hypothetical protein [Acidobacteria bacterium ACB2]